MYLVTTSVKASSLERKKAEQIARQLGFPYVQRRQLSLEELLHRQKAQGVLVVTKGGPSFWDATGGVHRFHLSMAHLRILEISRGRQDHLLEAIGHNTVSSLLDGTLGLGADSAVIAYGSPHLQRHVGIEGHPLLAYITNDGFRHFHHKDPSVTEALRKIQVLSMPYEDYLRRMKPSDFDVLYLDPMFEKPVLESPQFAVWRHHLLEGTVTEQLLQLGLDKVQRVVIKERRDSRLFRILPPTRLVGGKYSSIAYGVYE